MNPIINNGRPPLAIAMIPFANMAPFQEMGPPTDCRFVDCTPRESIDALRERRILAAALPVGGLHAVEDIVEPAGLYGIAAEGASLSVLFFSDRPFDDFGPSQTVRLTTQSASSVRLLYLLLGRRRGLSLLPKQADADHPADGVLVIGDTALQWLRLYEREGQVHGYRYVTDLATRWYACHRLPFVFARWVVHKQAPETFKTGVRQWLDAFSEAEPELIAQAAPKVAQRLDLPAAYVRSYLKIVRRCLSRHDSLGQDRFLEELARCEQTRAYPWV